MMKNLGELSRSLRKRPTKPEQPAGVEGPERDERQSEIVAEGDGRVTVALGGEEGTSNAVMQGPPQHADDDRSGDEVASSEGEPQQVGYIDWVDAQFIHGWAYDRLHPDRSVMVLVLLPDGREDIVQADLFRADVKAAGYGNGNHGFQIGYDDLKVAEGEVRVLLYETKQLLVGGIVALDPRKSLLNSTMPLRYEQAMKILAAQARTAYAAAQAPLIRP